MDFSSDTFSDTDGTLLSAHTPDLGTIDSIFDADGYIEGGALHATLFGASSALYGPAPTESAYGAVVLLRLYGDNTTGLGATMIRATVEGGLSGYAGGWNSDLGGWAIWRLDANVPTLLAGNALPTLEPDSVVSILLFAVGDSLQLNVDGELNCTVSDATYTAPGRGGLILAPIAADRFTLSSFRISDGYEISPGAGIHVVSGRGNVVLESPAWLSIQMVDLPDTVQSGFAEPANYYHVGMISWGTDHGAMAAYVVTRLIDLVQLPPGMTILYYEFAPGITATITELAAP